jgi:hypothetical protein
MNAIEAYNASSTCVCGGIPQLVEVDGKKQIRCACCGCAGPTDSLSEGAVQGWNINIEALTSSMTVIDIMSRDNPKLAELFSK